MKTKFPKISPAHPTRPKSPAHSLPHSPQKTRGEELAPVTQMWTNLRYTIDPTILAVATLVLLISVVLLAGLEFARRRSLGLVME